MNTKALHQAAEALHGLLTSYSATEPDARLCLQHLAPLLARARQPNFVPIKEAAPCAYYFHEGSLRKYPDLEKAFSSFSMAAQGISSERLQSLLGQSRGA